MKFKVKNCMFLTLENLLMIQMNINHLSFNKPALFHQSCGLILYLNELISIKMVHRLVALLSPFSVTRVFAFKCGYGLLREKSNDSFKLLAYAQKNDH